MTPVVRTYCETFFRARPKVFLSKQETLDLFLLIFSYIISLTYNCEPRKGRGNPENSLYNGSLPEILTGSPRTIVIPAQAGIHQLELRIKMIESRKEKLLILFS